MVTVIYLTKSKIIGVKVDEKRLSVGSSFELGWDVNTLDLSLKEILEKLKVRKIRILLDDVFSYVLRVSVPRNLSVDEERKYVSGKISEKIPEVLRDKDWDFKETQFKLTEGKDGVGLKEKDVIVFSPVKYIFDLLSKAVVNLSVEVEAVEAVEIAATRNSNPIIGIALKEDINGGDREVLNISIDKNRKEEDFKDILSTESVGGQETQSLGTQSIDGAGKIEGEPERKNPLIKMITIIIIIFIFAVAGFFLYKNYFDKSSETSSVVETVTPTTTPQTMATPALIEEVIDYSTYNLLIKNGSGIKGEAQNAALLLDKAGFTQYDTDNADSYDYIKTQISASENVPNEVVETAVSALSESYNVATESSVLSSSEYDIEVIVGKRK